VFQTKFVEKTEYTHFVINFFPKIVPFMRQCGRRRHGQRSHRWQYSTAQKICGLRSGHLRQEYRHTLRIFNTYYFSAATMVTRTRHDVTLYYTACLVRGRLGNLW